MTLRRSLALVASALAALVAIGGLAWGAPPATAEGDTIHARTMLVLDSSGSMQEPAADGKTKMEAAKAALRSVVDTLPEQAEVGLRVFGATIASTADPGVCNDTQLAVAPGTGNRDKLRSAIETFEPFGETPIPAALQEAAKDLGQNDLRSVVLVSDGESTCGTDVCQVAREIIRGGVNLHIDVVGLAVSEQARKQLQCIADGGNGTYVDADSAQTLAEQIKYRLAPVTHRASKPISISGTPLTGGTLSSPTPVTVGDWSDTLAPNEEKNYSFTRAVEGTAVRVSAVSTMGRERYRSMSMTVYGPDEGSCGSNSNSRDDQVGRLVSVGVVIGGPGNCPQAGTFRIKVGADSGKATSDVILRVTEEPKTSDVGASGEAVVKVAPPAVTGTPIPVTGGYSFPDAPRLDTGRWSANVVPGEAVMFKIPLTFGQYARIGVTFPPGSDGMQDVVRYSAPDAALSLYDPMHAKVGTPEGAKATGRASFNSDKPAQTSLFTVTSPISLSAKPPFRLGGGAGGDFTTTGDYYLSVSLSEADYTIEFPFTIDVEILGTAVSGPTYVDGKTWTVVGSLGDAGKSEGAGPNGSGASGGAVHAWDMRAIGGIAAGVAGIAVIAGALLWRRRARTS